LAGHPTPRRARRLLAASLLAAGTVMCLLGALSVWTNRQLLDTADWTATSAKLLANQEIDDALGAYLVDELFDNVDVAGSIRDTLPAQTEGLAGPAAAGVRGAAERAAPRLLAGPKVQRLWVTANRDAHRRLLQVVEGGGPAVSTADGVVTLDLRAVVAELVSTLGLRPPGGGARSPITLPERTGKLVILRSDQLGTAQDVVGAIRGFAIVFPVLALALFAAAVWFARGWRSIALRRAGWCLVVVGLLLILVRRVGGDELVSALVHSPSDEPAAHAVWDIATSLLDAIAVALIAYGVLIALAATLAGPGAAATRLRRAIAPALRDHAGLAYGLAGAAVLVAVVAAPTPAFREPVLIGLLLVLLGLGVTALRRQTARELAGPAPPER
jgi:hypothetical protein